MSSNNKTAIVIGGAGLLGKHFCQNLAQTGNNVVLADINIETARKVTKELNLLGFNNVHPCEINITSKTSLEKLVEESCNKFGGAHSLINTAYPRSVNWNASFFDVDYKDLCENLNLHVGGFFLASQVIGKYFADKKEGSIINIASIYGVVAPRFDIYEGTTMTTGPEYAIIKAGIIQLSKYMAQYFKGTGVRINSVCPGGISNNQPATFLQAYKSYCNTKGMLDPADVGGLVTFLASEQSKYITGQNITVDDGFSL